MSGFAASSIRLATCSLTILISVASLAQDRTNEFRQWTTKNGRKSDVKLAVVVSNEKTVRLKREDNGKVIELPIDHLSRDDQEYLRSIESSAATFFGCREHCTDCVCQQLVAFFVDPMAQECLMSRVCRLSGATTKTSAGKLHCQVRVCHRQSFGDLMSM